MGQYDSERTEVQNAFKDGMDTLFRMMFTETCYFALMDEDKTQVNDVYDETMKKVYHTPNPLTAKVTVGREQGEEEVKTVEQTAIIVVPVKQLDSLSIPHSTDADLETLQKGVFKYKGILFLVDKVLPKTHVADTFLFYEFSCTTRNKDGTVYEIPEV